MSPKPLQNKVRIAVLDESTAAQLSSNREGSHYLEVTWSGTSLSQLREAQPQVQVLLANIDYLGDEPAKVMDELVERTGAELGIALYAYAKRETLERIASPRIRTLRSPLNVPMLRCQMMSIIARNLLSPSASTSAGIAPQRYSAAQLGRLQQVSTTIDCECPNHIATLLQNLIDFEAYSKNCENRNEADAKVHRLLYESTARARALMEAALDKLVEHEKIEI
jgi:hypothetical protein